MDNLIERLNTSASESEQSRNFAGTPQNCREAVQRLTDIAAAIAPVKDWYQSDEEIERPLVDVLTDIVSDLQEDRQEVLEMKGVMRELEIANALVVSLTAERDGLKAEKWREQHTDTMNDAVQKGLAMESLTAENERLRGARNLAYGLLWTMQPIDRRKHKDDVACRARESLLSTMEKQDQSDGIDAARTALKGQS